MSIRLRTVLVVIATLLIAEAGPARSSEAATANHSLRATLALDNTTFPMGEPIVVRLVLDADSSLAQSGTILSQNDGAWTCSLVFTNTSTGAAYRRSPYDAGMPPTCTRERFIVLGSAPVIEEMRVHLLSADGKQIPPGRYRLHAVYDNVGVVEGHTHPDPRLHPDASRLWTGTIETAPVTIEIKAAGPESVELSIPQQVTYKLLMDASQIAVYWNEHSTEDVAVTRRPGYTVGLRYDATVMIDGEESDFHPRSVGGITLSSRVSAFMLRPEISRRVFAGAGMDLAITIEVFETSAPPAHLWNPEAGDFKVLWRGEVRGTYR